MLQAQIKNTGSSQLTARAIGQQNTELVSKSVQPGATQTVQIPGDHEEGTLMIRGTGTGNVQVKNIASTRSIRLETSGADDASVGRSLSPQQDLTIPFTLSTSADEFSVRFTAQ